MLDDAATEGELVVLKADDSHLDSEGCHDACGDLPAAVLSDAKGIRLLSSFLRSVSAVRHGYGEKTGSHEASMMSKLDKPAQDFLQWIAQTSTPGQSPLAFVSALQWILHAREIEKSSVRIQALADQCNPSRSSATTRMHLRDIANQISRLSLVALASGIGFHALHRTKVGAAVSEPSNPAPKSSSKEVSETKTEASDEVESPASNEHVQTLFVARMRAAEEKRANESQASSVAADPTDAEGGRELEASPMPTRVSTVELPPTESPPPDATSLLGILRALANRNDAPIQAKEPDTAELIQTRKFLVALLGAHAVAVAEQLTVERLIETGMLSLAAGSASQSVGTISDIIGGLDGISPNPSGSVELAPVQDLDRIGVHRLLSNRITSHFWLRGE